VGRACVTETRNIFTVFVGKYEGRRQPGRPRHQWEDNITPILQKQDRTWDTFNGLSIAADGKLP